MSLGYSPKHDAAAKVLNFGTPTRLKSWVFATMARLTSAAGHCRNWLKSGSWLASIVCFLRMAFVMAIAVDITIVAKHRG